MRDVDLRGDVPRVEPIGAENLEVHTERSVRGRLRVAEREWVPQERGDAGLLTSSVQNVVTLS